MSSPHETGKTLVLRAIRAFTPYDRISKAAQDRMLAFVASVADPFDRNDTRGHITGSALIVDPDDRSVCLGFHAKLNKWLQFGGHAEPGERDPLTVALREAAEEMGLPTDRFRVWKPTPIDLDIHTIPPYKSFPAHLHYDIRYLLLVARLGIVPATTSEHHALKWFPLSDLTLLNMDLSLRRLIERAHLALGPG